METGIRDRRMAVSGALVALLAACHNPHSLRSVEPDAQIASAAAARGEWRVAAERWYSVWLASGETDLRACRETAHAMIELGDAESASNLIDRGLALAGDDVELLELKARALVKLGFRRKAEEYLQRVLVADAQRTSALLELGRLRVELGLESSAIAPLRKYIAATGGDYASHVLLARALEGAGDPAGAFGAWRNAFAQGKPLVDDLITASALSLDPRVRAVHTDAIDLGKAWLAMATEENPQCTSAHFQQALIAEDQKDFAGAVTHYRRAIESDPACLAAVRNLALLYSKLGDAAGTREMVDRGLLLEKDPDRRKALQKLRDQFDAKPEPPPGG